MRCRGCRRSSSGGHDLTLQVAVAGKHQVWVLRESVYDADQSIALQLSLAVQRDVAAAARLRDFEAQCRQGCTVTREHLELSSRRLRHRSDATRRRIRWWTSNLSPKRLPGRELGRCDEAICAHKNPPLCNARSLPSKKLRRCNIRPNAATHIATLVWLQLCSGMRARCGDTRARESRHPPRRMVCLPMCANQQTKAMSPIIFDPPRRAKAEHVRLQASVYRLEHIGR